MRRSCWAWERTSEYPHLCRMLNFVLLLARCYRFLSLPHYLRYHILLQKWHALADIVGALGIHFAKVQFESHVAFPSFTILWTSDWQIKYYGDPNSFVKLGDIKDNQSVFAAARQSCVLWGFVWDQASVAFSHSHIPQEEIPGSFPCTQVLNSVASASGDSNLMFLFSFFFNIQET